MSSQKIGLATAVIVGMNAMIGSGVFTIPYLLAEQAGPAGILTTIMVGLMAWALALSFAKVAEHFPQEGSFYLYAKQWGGHIVGVIAGLAYLIGLCIAMGLLVKKAGLIISHDFFGSNPFYISLIILILLIILNMLGVVLSEIGQYILIGLTLFPLFAIIFLCLAKADVNNLVPFVPYGIKSIFSASRFVIFAFFGFESAASLFAIVENPSKNVPKALSYSLLIVAIIYILFVAAIIFSIPMEELVNAGSLTSVLSKMFPDKLWLIYSVGIAIAAAIIGTIHSMIWGASRLFLSFTRVLKCPVVSGLINKNIINEKTSVMLVGLCIFLTFLLLDNDGAFFDLTAIFLIFAYGSSIITILKIKDRIGKKDILLACIGLITAGLIMYFALTSLLK